MTKIDILFNSVYPRVLKDCRLCIYRYRSFW